MNQSPPNNLPVAQQQAPLTFFRRLLIAWSAFITALFNPAFAAQVVALKSGALPSPAPTAVVPPAPAPAPVSAPTPTPSPMKELSNDAALLLLGLLQREARLIDFTQEDVRAYSDADVGAAARVVHEGCCKVLREHFTIAPLRTEAEGSRIRLEEGFDARAIRLTGNVVGKAPFQGSLSHRGWRATDVRLPQLSAAHDATVLAQAEVEL